MVICEIILMRIGVRVYSHIRAHDGMEPARNDSTPRHLRTPSEARRHFAPEFGRKVTSLRSEMQIYVVFFYDKLILRIFAPEINL